MGYDLHITRKRDWFDDDGPAISLDEWLAYVESDAELRLDGHAEAGLPGGAVLRAEDPSMAVWTAWSGNVPAGNQAWMWLAGTGNVMAKNPSREMIAKMYDIALSLGAKVQGDECEVYGADGDPLDDSVGASATKSKTGFFQRIWKRSDR